MFGPVRRSIKKNHRQSPESRTGKPAMVTLKIQLDCSMVHDTTLWAKIYVRSHLGCGTDSVFICFCKSHKYFKDAKAMQINRILKISLIWHAQSTPKTIGILTKVFYTCDPYLVILSRTGLELSHGQASDWHTDGQTDAGNDNTWWTNWPWVITPINSFWSSDTIWWQEIWVIIGSGNGLLPDSTKPLPEPMLTDHQLNQLNQ